MCSTRNGHVVTQIPLVGDVDELWILSDVRRAFLADRNGAIDVIDLDKNTLNQSIPSAALSHTKRPLHTFSHNNLELLGRKNLVGVYRVIRIFVLSFLLISRGTKI